MKIHMVGVGGISMRALARYLVDAGHEVTGCDINSLALLRFPEDPLQTGVRQLLGFPIIHGHDATHVIGADQVIINSAITPSHPGWQEVVAAQQDQIPVIKRAQKIGEITRERSTIAISGTHGKTTTTGMVAHILLEANRDPFVMIGARVDVFAGQSYRPGSGPLVLEADEFDRSFLSFSPVQAVITNIEADHLDYYTQGLSEIIEAFGQFMLRVLPTGHLILNGGDPHVRAAYRSIRDHIGERTVVWYGRESDCTFRMEESQLAERRNQFVLTYRHERERVRLAVPGIFNQENATAAIAAATIGGVSLKKAVDAVNSYRGVDMRFEILAERDGVTILSDYGHHPTEVQLTLDALRAWYPGRRLVLFFQPHQYARTKLLFHDFIRALTHADEVWVTDIYGVAGREESDSVSAEQLVRALQTTGFGPVHYLPLADLRDQARQAIMAPGVFVMMGAGLDIRQAAQAVATELQADERRS